MKKIIILFLLFLSFFCGAQKNLDSIIDLTKSKDLNTKIGACADLALIIKKRSVDSAMTFAMLAEKSLTPETKGSLKSLVYHVIGCVYSEKLEYAEAKPWYDKAYEIRLKEKDELGQLATLINLVYVYQGLGDLKNTHKYVFEVERLCDKIATKDSHLYIVTQIQLGDIYYYLKRFDRSEEFYKRAIESAEIAKKDNELALVYQNYGAFLIGQLKYKEAEPVLERGLIFQKKMNQPKDLESAMVNLAIVYAETGRKQEGLKLFQEIYESRKKDGSDYEISTAGNNLAYFYVTEEKYDKAIPLFLESLESARKAKASRLMMQRYEILGECYEAVNDYKKAYKFRTLYGQMKDSIFNLETVKQLNELTEKFGTEKKEKKILELQKNNAESKLKEEQTKRESQRNTIIFGCIIALVLVILVFIYISFLQKKKANGELTIKNEQIERQNVLLEVKQKEILDSIHYAKRIQDSLLPTEKYIGKKVSELQKKQYF
jgi:tetratricopeptide (TPR) repeat protein